MSVQVNLSQNAVSRTWGDTEMDNIHTNELDTGQNVAVLVSLWPYLPSDLSNLNTTLMNGKSIEYLEHSRSRRTSACRHRTWGVDFLPRLTLIRNVPSPGTCVSDEWNCSPPQTVSTFWIKTQSIKGSVTGLEENGKCGSWKSKCFS